MAINASHIVSVNPGLLEPAGTSLEFNGLLLTRNASIPVSGSRTGGHLVLPFASADAAGAYFGRDSEEYRLASVYFQGYTGSYRKPRVLYIARRLDEAAAPFLRGGPVALSLEDLRQVTSGSLTLTLGAHTATVSGIDLSGVTSPSEAALRVQEALRSHTAGGEDWTGASVSWSSLFRAFTITGGRAGADLAVDFADGSLAGPLGLSREAGAVLSQGAAPMTPAEQMAAIAAVTRNWVTFTTVWKASHEDMVAFARWAADQGTAYLYAPWDNDPALLQPGNVTTSAHALRQANAGATALWWGDARYAVFMAGVAASIDWERRDGSITFAFKAQEGLPASVETLGDALALEAQGVNYIGDFATRNDQFVLSYSGCMFGSWRWIDTYVNAVWLFNALQVALVNGLRQTPRVPYTERGYGLVRSWIQDPVNRALSNGAITPGMTLTEGQRARINREAGTDISRNVEREGYFIRLSDPPPANRAGRESPIVSLWYTDAGAIHKLDVTSTALS
ncbi:DUF3383 domain-containing protein [Phaeovibrio sulfidiphilus]|uniref:DUF3383 domain-containing protein n=1 Tax=Phaeovibrio sulfidiphilus TaxID=1220600 RepID=A0A8J6YP97_9PROT|nr:DUF3383 domain-containing protein [Phaeovibrio sulfidiphilus]MBE1237494.1 DUF3383 domain-containing protein [Phaeovibrio sulfidiphilus]